MSSIMETASLVHGRVRVTEGEIILVATDEGTTRAQRAVSCLVDPEPGDRVLLSTGAGETFVLAVLERETSGATISVNGDARLVARGGIHLMATDGVNVLTREDVSIRSNGLDMQTNQTRLRARETVLESGTLTAGVDRLRIVARTVDMLADRMLQKFKSLFRRVEETEDVRAGDYMLKADRLLNARGRHTIVTSSDYMKINGKQINMG